MQWPRGKYNGQRICGFVLKFRLDLFWWRIGLPNRYGQCLSIGPIHIWTEAAYDQQNGAYGRLGAADENGN